MSNKRGCTIGDGEKRMSGENRNGTSLKEQSLLFFIRKYIPEAVNRKIFWINKKRIEVDIYIPEYRLAIEYDGAYWHRNKIDIDNEKTKILNELGYKVLHIREYGLPALEPFDGDVIELQYTGLNERNYDYINRTLFLLSVFAENEGYERFEVLPVDEPEFNDSLKHIYAMRYSEEVAPNLSDMCGIEYWDSEKNAPLIVQNIGKLEWAPAILKCPEGLEIPLPRYHREFVSICREKGDSCEKCLQNIMCPLFRFCKKSGEEPIHCAFVEEKVWKMINQQQTLHGFDLFYTFKRWMMEESDIGKSIIAEFESNAPRSKTREDIAYFLGIEREIYKDRAKNGEFDIHSLF